MLQFIRSTGKASEETDMWMAYCCFHSGDYIRAKTVSRCSLGIPPLCDVAMVTISVQEYEGLSQRESCTPDVWGNLACCYFMLGMYAEADSATEKGEICLFPYLST